MNTNTDRPSTERLPCVFPMRVGHDHAVEKLVMASLREYAEFRVEKNNWYRHGDGRPSFEGGRGLTFPHCIHGMSRWLSYDNICGPCEDGWGYWHYGDTLELYAHVVEYAYEQMARRFAKVHEFLENLETFEKRSNKADEMRSAMMEWAIEPIVRFS